MSELKGQILGVLLVLALFGAVAGVLGAAFNNTANKLKTDMSNYSLDVTPT